MKGFRFFPASLIVVLSILLSAALLPVSAAGSAEDGGFHFTKISELQRIQPKRPVRIKLKRTVKGEYSWELSGDDAGEILKVDMELRKVLIPSQERKNRGDVNR
jgi:hypothetical protein